MALFAVEHANVSSSGSLYRAASYWHDREIRFDTPPAALRIAASLGEAVCAMFDHVEDTKGNNGQAGTLVFTNLRVLWWSNKRRTLNLSIGWGCVLSVSVQTTASKLFGGTAEALFVTTKYNGSRFQFVFTLVHTLSPPPQPPLLPPTRNSSSNNSMLTPVTAAAATTALPPALTSTMAVTTTSTGLTTTTTTTTTASSLTRTRAAVPNGGSGGNNSDGGVQQRRRLVDTAQCVWRAYDGSRLFREVRMRAALIEHGRLLLLPREQVLSQFTGVSHVSKEQGHMGTLFITNVRLVWFAVASAEFNASLPYMQLSSVSCKQSKYGRALVVAVSPYAGGYVFGFRVDPVTRLRVVFREVMSFWTAWRERPLLGVTLDKNNTKGDGEQERASVTRAAAMHRDAAAASSSSTSRDDGNKAASRFVDSNSTTSAAASSYNKQPHGGGDDDDDSIDDAHVVQQAPTDAFAAYYMDMGQKGADRRPVYDMSLGLAVEKPRHGVTLQQLWAVPTL